MKKRIISILLLLATIISLFTLTSCEKESINHYDINIHLIPNEHILEVTQTTKYIHKSEIPTSEVCFNLYQNTTREGATFTAVPKDMQFTAYPNGNSYGGITFKDIKIAEKTANYKVGGIDKNFLTIDLETQLQKGDEVAITMQYQVKLANINSRLGYGNETINLGNFYPILAVFEEDEEKQAGEFFECIPYPLGDPFYSDIANYDVEITVPNEYQVASSGEETKQTQLGKENNIKFQGEKIRSFCMVCSDEFELQQQIKNGIKINYYYIDDKTPTETTALIANALDLYEKSFGKYAYPTFTVCDANFFQGGMEYSSLVMISTSAPENFRKIVIAHETAHQWWETMVGVNEVNQSVLDEGLAEFTTSYFFQNYPEYKIDPKKIIDQKEKQYQTYLEILNVLDEQIPPTIVQPLSKYRSSYDYYTLVYVRGELIFQEISDMVGKEQFISFLKQFKTQSNMKNATIEDFISQAKEEFGIEKAEEINTLFYPIK